MFALSKSENYLLHKTKQIFYNVCKETDTIPYLMNTLRNQVQLIGNLGNDPEIITYDNNKKMAKISLATNESYTNAKGEKIENTQWHKVVFFGKIVEVVEQYLQKGKEVLISGKITYSEYTDKEGNKRYSTEIVANDLLLLGTK